VVGSSNVPVRQKLVYNCSVMRSRVIVKCAVTRELNNISKTALLEGMKKFKERQTNLLIKDECILNNKNK
jgi:hypothetical protein